MSSFPTPARRDLSPSVPNRSPSPNRARRQATPEVNGDTSRPLLDPATPKAPPAAGPEVEEVDNRETVTNPYPGVDDGFFARPETEVVPLPKKPDADRGKFPDRRDSFPRAPGYDPEFDYPATEFGGESIPDVNVYQHKKTLAQGMMDLALFSANANQLRYVLESYERHPYYYPSVVLISFSLILQVAVGVGLIWNAKYNVKDKVEICIANKISNFTIIGIFLITVVNVFVSAFGVANVQTTTTTP